jgi:hypothetical protein
VSIPPALGILNFVGLGALFGAYGVLFATPLLLVAMTLVRMLYVEDTLGDRNPACDSCRAAASPRTKRRCLGLTHRSRPPLLRM